MTLRGIPTPPGRGSGQNRTNNQSKVISQLITKEIDLTDYALVTSLQSQVTQANSSLSQAQSALTQAQTDLATANSTILDLQTQLQNQPGPSGDVMVDYLDEDLSTWNYYDGGQNKVSYSYDAPNKIHNFTLTAGNASGGNYIGNTNTSSRVPVFYRPMTYVDGSPVLNTDSFIIQVEFEDLVLSATNWSIYVGTMGNEQGNSSTTRQGFGVGFNDYFSTSASIGALNNTIIQSNYQYQKNLWPESKMSGKGLMMTTGNIKHRLHAAMSWKIYGQTLDIGQVAPAGVSNASSSASSYTFSSADGTPLNLCVILSARDASNTPQSGIFSTKIKWCVEKW
jgi:hypothetical protein